MPLDCLKINVFLQFLREVERPLCVVLCEESPYDLINVLGPFSVTLKP